MTTALKPPMKPHSYVRKIECARNCGYRRPYTDAAWYLQRQIDHPLYGRVTGERLVQLDLWNHICDVYLERRARARKATGYKGRIYSAGPASPR